MDTKDKSPNQPIHNAEVDGKDLSIEEEVKLTLNEKIKKKIYSFIESTPVIVFMMVFTVWVLFSDDIRQVAVDANNDSYFYYVVLVCFGLFSLEIILTFYSKPDYRWGFFFWLDIISTFSLLLDTQWVSDLIFIGSTGTNANQKNATNFAKTARASRIGTRASRIVRIIRLIRLIRIVKLYKATKQAEVKSEVKKKEYKAKMAAIARKKAVQLSSNSGSGRNLLSMIVSKKRSVIESKGGDLSHHATPTIGERSSFKKLSEAGGSQMGSFVLQKGFSSVEAGAINSSKVESSNVFKHDGTINDAFIPEVDEFTNPKVNQYEETNVGKQLSDLTIKRVIILILSIMISIPIFSIDTYWPDYSCYISGTKNLIYLLQRNTVMDSNILFQKGWKAYVDLNTNGELPSKLLNISLLQANRTDSIDGPLDFTDRIMNVSNASIDMSATAVNYLNNHLRSYERKTIIEPEFVDSIPDGQFAILVIFDMSYDFNLNSYLNIGRTIFVCIILSASAIFFSKDANELVLVPIENMLKKVKRIAENPLRAALIEEEQVVFWNDFNKAAKKAKAQSKDQDNYETTILEKTIVKIGGLLALGFGEAGAEIVAKNMQNGGEVDPMLPGKKVVAIFGFCDIRNFTDATEVLQEGVMVFVNEIAEIVHSIIDLYSGAPNKNIGDAFLLVWKFDDEDVITEPYTSELTVDKENPKVNSLTELAVFSFLKIPAALAKASKLKKYRNNVGLIERLQQPEFRVRMGFGMHVGWAIEGAIGSKYKIDASYLSPHVNISARLEAATKQYGVNLLISDKVKELVREPLKGMMRNLDNVIVKGSSQNIQISTIDLIIPDIFYNLTDETTGERSGIEKKRARLKLRKERDILKYKFISRELDIKTLLTLDDDIVSMRASFTNEFYREWNTAINNYLRGDWSKAKDGLSKTLTMVKNNNPKASEHALEDGPSKTILAYMAKFNYVKPSEWQGFRALTEK